MANQIAEFNTNKGNFKIELFNDKAPVTTGNFMKLVDDGFYNGLIFHRVIPNFMIQAGCPHGTGRGGPGYTIKDEFHPDLKHDQKGILSMANAGPNTGSSQFFINLVDNNHLDNRHPVFGKVVEGMDVVDSIGRVDTNEKGRPLEDVVLIKAELIDS